MFAYRVCLAIITSFEMYYMALIDEGIKSGGPLEFMYQFIIAANFLLAMALLISEMPCCKSMPFSDQMKDAGVLFETAIKLILVQALGASSSCSKPGGSMPVGTPIFWGTNGSNLEILLLLIRIDISAEIIGAALRPYWPEVIKWINLTLRWINQQIFAFALCVKERLYWIVFLIISCCRWIKNELETALTACLHSCGHDKHVDWGACRVCCRLICGFAASVFDSTMSLLDHCFKFCCLNVRTPRCVGYYEEIAPDPEAEEMVGFIQHIKSGQFIFPEQGQGGHLEKLILGPPVRDPAFAFRFFLDGSVEHIASGLFVHPAEGEVLDGMRLHLHAGAHVKKLAFTLDNKDGGDFKHSLTGFYILPGAHLENGKRYLYFHSPQSLSYHYDKTDPRHSREAVENMKFRVIRYAPQEKRCNNGHVMRVLTKLPTEYVQHRAIGIQCDQCGNPGLGAPPGSVHYHPDRSGAFYHCEHGCNFDCCLECPRDANGRMMRGV